MEKDPAERRTSDSLPQPSVRIQCSHDSLLPRWMIHLFPWRSRFGAENRAKPCCKEHEIQAALYGHPRHVGRIIPMSCYFALIFTPRNYHDEGKFFLTFAIFIPKIMGFSFFMILNFPYLNFWNLKSKKTSMKKSQYNINLWSILLGNKNDKIKL